MRKKILNKDLLLETLETIKNNPEHFTNEDYHIGTKHSFAGFAELLYNEIPLNTDSEELQSFEDENIAIWCRNYGEDWDGDDYDDITYDDYEFYEWNSFDNAKDILGISKEKDAYVLFHLGNTIEKLEILVNHIIEHGNLKEFYPEYIV